MRSNVIHLIDTNTTPDDVIRATVQSGDQENAFLVMDVGDIVKKHYDWKKKMPRVTPFYAVKCNDTQLVLEVLASLGTGFDCASRSEIAKIQNLGVDASRIIFSNPTKVASHISYAADRGDNTMTFDNDSELYKVKALHHKARMVLRIRCDAAIAERKFGTKFGCNASIDGPHLLKLAAMLGIDIVGISFHVGSGCREPEAFRRAIAAARGLFDLGTELGFTMNLLDIGGGYPGNHGSSIDDIAEAVNKALEDFFPVVEMGGVQVISEPGTFYVASAFTLAAQIHSKRDNMYYINDGMYGCLSCNLHRDVKAELEPLLERPGKLLLSSVFGPTCDSRDQVAEDILLPPLEIGDWLVFRDMGAYTLCLATNFNGFEVPEVYAVIDSHLWFFLKDRPPLADKHFTPLH